MSAAIGIFNLRRGLSLGLEADAGRVVLVVYDDHTDGGTEERRIALDVATATDLSFALSSAIAVASRS